MEDWMIDVQQDVAAEELRDPNGELLACLGLTADIMTLHVTDGSSDEQRELIAALTRTALSVASTVGLGEIVADNYHRRIESDQYANFDATDDVADLFREMFASLGWVCEHDLARDPEQRGKWFESGVESRLTDLLMLLKRYCELQHMDHEAVVLGEDG